jgi:hypothetical protein
MGIVAAVSVPSTGLQLPAAYLAVADQMMVSVSRGDGIYDVRTVYSAWNSHQDRLAGREPVHRFTLQFEYAPKGGVQIDDLYGAAYDEIKKLYDEYEDVQAAEPAPEPVEPEP